MLKKSKKIYKRFNISGVLFNEIIGVCTIVADDLESIHPEAVRIANAKSLRELVEKLEKEIYNESGN